MSISKLQLLVVVIRLVIHYWHSLNYKAENPATKLVWIMRKKFVAEAYGGEA